MPYQFDEHNPSQNAYFDIARGHFQNVKPIHLFGFNRTVGTTYETIMNDGGGIYAFPPSAVQMSLVSTNAADTMAVYIHGLDADYNELTETVTLAGLTPVTTSGSFLRINSATITTSINAGNITITNGGAEYAYIEAGLGVTQQSIYSVPANATLYVNAVSFSSGTVNPNKYLFGRAHMHTSAGAELTFWESTWAVGFLQFIVPVPFVVPAKTDFSFEAKSSSGENEISVYINGHLVINE